MVGCDDSIAQTSQSYGSYMEVCPFGHHMLGTSLAQMEICPAVVGCNQMPQEMFYEDDGSLSDNNNTDDERMAPFKDAQINMIWWLNISQYSMWCAYHSLNLPISAACHMQSLVF